EAEVEGFLDLLTLPPVAYRLAPEHLEEEVRPAARGVLLFAEHHVARAHGASTVTATLADAHAAERGVREAPVVLREPEVGGRCGRAVIGAKSQIRGPGVGVGDLAGIHHPVGVPDRLELAERP